MKKCPGCSKDVEDDVEFCECGKWFRSPTPLPAGEAHPYGAPEDNTIGTRVLNLWGGGCLFLAGAAFPQKGALIAMGLFAGGYLASHLLMSWLNSLTQGLHGAHKVALAFVYFVMAFILMVVADQIAH
jgi:hypothetical protein